MERLVYNIILLDNSIGNESLDLWYVTRKLKSKSYKELASMANISTAPREEEAGPKTFFIIVSVRDSPCNRRFSRAS
jgi:hypothetical protein